jgi:hypothetical protein
MTRTEALIVNVEVLSRWEDAWARFRAPDLAGEERDLEIERANLAELAADLHRELAQIPAQFADAGTEALRLRLMKAILAVGARSS